MKCFRSNNNGSAIILTILLTTVIITVGIGFNWIVKEHLRTTEVLKKKAAAMVQARSAYDALAFSILSGKLTPQKVLFTSGALGVREVPLDGKRVHAGGGTNISVQDVNGLISLSDLDPAVFERLIGDVAPGKREKASIITSSLRDWTDTDDLTRINGAEKSFYFLEGKPYGPRNYPLQYKRELELVRGMDRKLYRKLSPSLTILPANGFNPNTASDDVLMAYLDINMDTVKKLRDYMSTFPLVSDSQLFALTGRTIANDAGVYFFPGRFMEITVRAGKPKTEYTIRAGIDLKPQALSPYAIVYWKEG